MSYSSKVIRSTAQALVNGIAVDQSEVDITHRIASSFDQHASLLKHQCSHLFDYRRPRRLSNQAGVSLSQIADPTTRRGGSVARRAG